MGFYKDDATLKAVSLAPNKPIKAPPPAGTTLGSIARSYNAVGGLVDRLSTVTGIETLAALAVWMVESGGRPFTQGKPVLRFENHVFWDRWGCDHPKTFDAHFVFGGHGADGKRWEGHKWREKIGQPYAVFHGAQQKEYDVYHFARTLSGVELAAQSASWGGTQVMGFNCGLIGYASAFDMVNAFARDLSWQVLGFFDFCRSAGLVDEIRAHDWIAFGNGYNGAGGGVVYGPKLKAIYDLKKQFDALLR
ncbi:MAG: DUF3380 domain-containing protein [Proteobacteria bacterium]|nr:DUF3380 domain-containing protein [Pseudomonadota bacterium]